MAKATKSRKDANQNNHMPFNNYRKLNPQKGMDKTTKSKQHVNEKHHMPFTDSWRYKFKKNRNKIMWHPAARIRDLVDLLQSVQDQTLEHDDQSGACRLILPENKQSQTERIKVLGHRPQTDLCVTAADGKK